LLILRDIQGLTYGEIMKITGLPEGTVKSRLHRARTALRRTYDAQEEGS
jgi:RNA polymerase sigma-70 factor (ECF subfamily)